MSAPTPSRRLLDPAMLLIVALGVAGAVVTWRSEGWTGVFAVAAEDAWLFLGILPKVAAGCLIGALITLLVPRETVVRLVGGSPACAGSSSPRSPAC